MKYQEAKRLIVLEWDRWIQAQTIDSGRASGRDSLPISCKRSKFRTIIRRESHWQSRILRKGPTKRGTARNSLSQWLTPATAVANRRK